MRGLPFFEGVLELSAAPKERGRELDPEVEELSQFVTSAAALTEPLPVVYNASIRRSTSTSS
jgi:hypothetical protein